MIRDTADENRVVTFGFFDGTLEDLQRARRSTATGGRLMLRGYMLGEHYDRMGAFT